jgi:hypothetical protein
MSSPVLFPPRARTSSVPTAWDLGGPSVRVGIQGFVWSGRAGGRGWAGWLFLVRSAGARTALLALTSTPLSRCRGQEDKCCGWWKMCAVERNTADGILRVRREKRINEERRKRKKKIRKEKGITYTARPRGGYPATKWVQGDFSQDVGLVVRIRACKWLRVTQVR